MSLAHPAAGVRLCALDELGDPGARGFAFDPPEGAGEGAWPFRGIVVRKAAEVVGYVDSCPHVGAPLDAGGGRYLTRKADFLMCFNHGALFRIADGACVAGPCVGHGLRPWPVVVIEGAIVTA